MTRLLNNRILLTTCCLFIVFCLLNEFSPVKCEVGEKNQQKKSALSKKEKVKEKEKEKEKHNYAFVQFMDRKKEEVNFIVELIFST